MCAACTLLFRDWVPFWPEPAVNQGERAQAPWVVPPMADAALVRGNDGKAPAKVFISVCLFSEEASDRGPELGVLYKGSFGIDVEFWAKAIPF